MATSSSSGAPSTARRDFLIAIEQKVQQKWDEQKVFETQADPSKEHYFVNFPYPYMNGSLHLGHAFSLSKCEFAAGYQRLKGKNVLFPFAFHCTGMPIKACADKLKRELELYGCPPQFPDDKPAAGAAEGAHSKVEAKTGGEKFQWNILAQQGIPEAEIPKFQDANYWLQFFPPLAKSDLQHLGVKVDWRRSFITTPVNAFYDSFVCWQFNRLFKAGYVKYGKRPTIFSIRDNQPCMDHDRATGEGVGVQEYTLIKLQLTEPFPAKLAPLAGRHVFLVAGTLRPETMYGQTNCWVKPSMEYGAYEINDKEVFICTERSALNMAYQDLTKEPTKLSCLLTITGEDLIGLPVSAPLSFYKTVYVLPMLSIKDDKGTGVVTSVPSDSPDDFAALRDLKNKEAMRQKFHLKDEMVLPFNPVPIIRTPTMGDVAAEKACEEFRIVSQNDAASLALAKEKVYKEGFYEGVFIYGEHSGKKVQDAKPLVRQQLLDANQAVKYYEPESKVMSRSGDECIVAKVDQWYLDYSDEAWKAKAKEALKSLETYSSDVRQQFEKAIDWLHEWACSRSYGLGSRIPWDQKYLIESLSDSTIYMAYYTVAHLLQDGALYGSGASPLGITPEQMTDDVWDYVFLKSAPFPASTKIAKDALDKLRHEFQYWYGFDLRSSGKDLVPNHLTFALFNHVAIWPDEPDRWPRSIRANGHIMVDGRKMSKREGNFLTVKHSLSEYGCDAVRYALADAGDTTDDGNFEQKGANAFILRLYAQLEWIKEVLSNQVPLRDEPVTNFADRAFESIINKAIALTDAAYSKMLFREALIQGYFELSAARDFYRELVPTMNRALIRRYIEVSTLLLSPICPHFAEHVWELLGNAGSVLNASWPTAGPVDEVVIQAVKFLESVASNFRHKVLTSGKTKGKGAKDKSAPKPGDSAKPTHAVIFYSAKYPAWQEEVLKTMHKMYSQSKTFPENKDILATLKENPVIVPALKNVMPFVAQVKANVDIIGESALNLTTNFDEFAVLNEALPYLTRSLDLQELTLSEAEKAEGKLREQISPGNPAIQIL